MLQAKARRHALAADAVVPHRHFQHAVLDMAPHLDTGGVAVADGVGDALLHGAVDAVFLILRERQPGQRLFQLDLRAAALRHAGTHLIERTREVFFFQRVRPQRLDRAPDIVHSVAGGVGYQLHLVPCHLGRVVHHLDAGVCARCDAREHMA